MKIIKYLSIVILSLTCLCTCSTQDGLQDAIYFTGTENTPILKYSLEEPTSVGISIRSSSKVSEQVNATLFVEPSLLEQYNKEKGTNYTLLDPNVYELEQTEAIIEKGNYMSKPIMINIKSIDSFKDESTYCIPVAIKDVSNNSIPILQSSRVVYVILNRTIITKAAKLSGNFFKIDFASDPARDLSAVNQVTMEARIYVNSFQTIKPYISSIMGLEEHFLLRIGDVTIKNDQLQLAGGGYPVTAANSLSPNTWTHIAVTFDGAKIRLYINGEEEGSTDAPRGPINLNGIDDYRRFYIGRTSLDYLRPLDGYISEARIWTRALSQSELKNSICAVSPDSPDLLAYWKFNQSNGKTVVDYTGHGYDAIANGDIIWTEGVRCP